VSLEPVVEHGDDARAAPITGSSKRQRVDEQVGSDPLISVQYALFCPACT
jgi:hypothetical protein